jgi:hypothetical protein
VGDIIQESLGGIIPFLTGDIIGIRIHDRDGYLLRPVL